MKSVLTRYGRILITRHEDSYYAIDDKCSHDDVPLHTGTLNGTVIECCRHGAQFDVRTGECLRMPATEPVETYPIRVMKDADGTAMIQITFS